MAELDPNATHEGGGRGGAPAGARGEAGTPGARLRSIPELLSALARDLGVLVRKETELARTELAEKVDQIGTGASQLGAAALVTYAGALVLLAALVLVLDLWLAALWASALIIGALVTAIGLALLARGRRNLRGQNLAPERTANSLRDDLRVARDELSRMGKDHSPTGRNGE